MKESMYNTIEDISSEDCVNRAKEIVNFFQVSVDTAFYEYVRGQSQHIIEQNRGHNLGHWCNGWLMYIIIYQSNEFQAFVKQCKDKYKNDINVYNQHQIKHQIITQFFSFESQYNHIIDNKITEMKLRFFQQHPCK